MKLIISLFLLGMVVLVGCSAPTRTVPSIPPGEFCMTAEGLQRELDKSYKAGQLDCNANVVLRNPTCEELCKFLKDNEALTRCDGNCIDHTINLSEAAYKAGYQMYVVIMNAKELGQGHVIGAFNTKDAGMVFIESQTLWEVKVESGFNYAENYRIRGRSFPEFTIIQIGIFK